MPPSQRGALVVVEGLDRVGKTTQVARLVARLSSAGHPVTQIKFPDRTTPTGKTIDAYLRTPAAANASDAPSAMPDHAIHLLFAANRWETIPSITAHLEAGTTVVVDRYAFSGAAYSAAKARPDLDLDWAWAPDVGLPAPDVVMILVADESMQEARGGWGAERYEGRAMQRRVRECFGALWPRVRGVAVRTVDAGGTPEEVERAVWRCVQPCVEGERGELGALKLLFPEAEVRDASGDAV